MNRIASAIAAEWADRVNIAWSKAEPEVGWPGGYTMYSIPMEIDLSFVPSEAEIQDFYKFRFEPAGESIEVTAEVEIAWEEEFPQVIRIVKIWSKEFHEPA
jgi:hypothetical protein